MQTKRLKQEKEEAKAKQKKHRDAFLRMLAERTEIDAQTRWRQVQLQFCLMWIVFME